MAPRQGSIDSVNTLATGDAVVEEKPGDSLIGEASPSPAGPLEASAATLPPPPMIPGRALLQVLRFNQRQIEFLFRGRRQFGETFQMRNVEDAMTVISHPDHMRSIFTASPEQTPSLSNSSPLVPVVGPDSVLTAIGERHMRQRKLLLPHFHGDAVEGYVQAIVAGVEEEIDRWPVGRPFALLPRMQTIALDTIMTGLFGIQGKLAPGSLEYWLRLANKSLLAASRWPLAKASELVNVRIPSGEAAAPMRSVLWLLDRPAYALIQRRRHAEDLDQRTDILSMLLKAETEDGETLSDRDVRNELLCLVFAGHETTAISLAWAWERLLRTPEAHERLREAVRSDQDAAEQIDATIYEVMRSRPVVPAVGRRVTVPWQFGSYSVPPGSAVYLSALLLHHREDLYPRPFDFLPERWLGRKPGTYDWIPFGGGIRRCLGVTLAMAELRIVMEIMTRRLDLEADDLEPERVKHRNITMLPSRDARVIVRARR